MQEFLTFLNHHPYLTNAALLLFILLTVVEFIRAKRNSLSITTQDATHKINRENAVVVDIRSNDLYRKGHIIDAVSIPSQEIQGGGKKIEKYRTKPIIVVCSRGIESQKIAALLLKQGYNAYSLTGGITTWTDANLPLVKE